MEETRSGKKWKKQEAVKDEWNKWWIRKNENNKIE